MNAAEEPGLDPDQFEALVSRRLEKMSDVEIRHWLRHGCGPLAADRRAAHTSIGLRIAVDVFSEMERRPRLAGTLALAARLEGVLWFPSRRLERPELQGGGYTDITTRGAAERILPIQLALDGEEFIRRFAEGELLYFHREEPREPVTEELILLLDQGVRTWGNVRLVLSSAVVALARQARRRRIAVKLAATSNEGEAGRSDVDRSGGPLDLDRGERSFAAPGRGAPEAACERAAEGRRDVVVLTHPLNLNEPEVSRRGRGARATGHAGTRLFAVAVDSKGRLELAELRRGLPIVLAQQSDRGRAARRRLSRSMLCAEQTAKWGWKGEFEPIGFPFCCGLLERLEQPEGSGRRPDVSTVRLRRERGTDSGRRSRARPSPFHLQDRRDGVRAPADAGARRSDGAP